MGCSPSPGRYHRLPLPEQGAPLETQFDAFVSVIRVSGGGRGARSCRVGLCIGPDSVEMLRVGLASGFPQRESSFCVVWGVEYVGDGCQCVRGCVCAHLRVCVVCVCVSVWGVYLYSPE